ncbi:MAG: AAA family ATPase [Candidatus Limnocylindrales bacterium]
MRWRLPDGAYDDGLKGLKLSALPLYNTHLLEERPADPVHFVEGEVAADEGTSHGLLTVSLCGGAAQQHFGDALDVLAGRMVSLLPDNDEPGRTLMDRVGRAIASTAADVRLVTLPDLPEKGDLADWFRAGGTVERLLELATTAPLWAPARPTSGFAAESVDTWLTSVDDPLDVVIGDGGDGAVLPIDGKGFIAGPTGIGKTNLLLRLGRALAEGGSFLGLPIPHPRRVVNLSVEGSRRGLRKRLAKVWCDASPEARSRFHLALIRLNLADDDDLARLSALLSELRPEVLIIDPLRNAHPWDENSSQEMALLTSLLDGVIAEHHCALIAAHHDRKRSPLARRDAVGTDRVRGSTALTGWLSFCLSIESDPQHKDTLVGEWTKVRDAEEALSLLTISFQRETLDFAADQRSRTTGKLSDQQILDAVFQNEKIRMRALIPILHAATGAGERTIRDRVREVVKAHALVEFSVPGDRAKWYRVPGDQEEA